MPPRSYATVTASMKTLSTDTSKQKMTTSEKFTSYFKTDATSKPSVFQDKERGKRSINALVRDRDTKVVEEPEELLPLLGPAFQWYQEKGVNAAANMTRFEERIKSSIIMEDNETKVHVHGSVTGTLIEVLSGFIETAGTYKCNDFTCKIHNGEWSNSSDSKTG